jgi:hypothetical protein
VFHIDTKAAPLIGKRLFCCFTLYHCGSLNTANFDGTFDGIFIPSERDTVMPLTDLAVRRIQGQEKPTKLADERGLYLLVSKAGKYWRFDYRFASKRKTLALGVYPDVTLAVARERREEALFVCSQN